ncbi:MAG: PfkB family carbohydrate kinase, partial [Clostridia bacterium]
MLTIVCMNPSIDRTLTVANWIHGGTNRALHTRSDPGGKGVNVARIAQCHGLNVHLTGFWGTD